MFRWKGIIFLAVLVLAVVVLSFLLTDRWLERQIEETGSTLVGARVEIDDLDFSLTGVRLTWQRIQVTDPKNTWKNLFETGVCDFDLEFWPLLSKKLIVESLRINDLRTYTDRQSDGRLPREAEQSEPGFIARTVKKLSDEVATSTSTQFRGAAKKVNVDSIMQMLDLRSVQKIDSLTTDLTSRYESWSNRLKQMNLEQEVKSIESQVKSIDINKIKKLNQLQSTLKTANSVKKRAESISASLGTTKNELLSDMDRVKSDLGRVDQWIAADYQRARSMAKLPDISAGNIGKLIFGPGLVRQYTTYLGYIGSARHYANKLKSDKPEKKKPARLKGQDIYFYSPNSRPDLWIKEISLSGETQDQLKLTGLVSDVVSDQRFINKPTLLNITGSKPGGVQFALSGQLNYLQDIPHESFEVSYSGFSLANTDLSGSAYLPNRVKDGRGALQSRLDLRGEEIESTVRFDASGLTFDFSKTGNPKNEMEKIIQRIVAGIELINFTARISGQKDRLKFQLSSNLDDLFARNLQAALSEELESAKKKIRGRIDQEVQSYRARLNALVKEKEDALRARLARYEALVKKETDRVNSKKKEIEQRIDKEQKKLGKDAARKLKKLFK